MNKAKALLDSLMGPSRNLSAKERNGEDFKRSDVCKNYLAGFCPEALLCFVEIDKGKVEISPPEPCPKLHSVAMREELEKHPKAEKYKREYEDGLRKRLEEIAAEVLVRSAVERRRCRAKETPPMPEAARQKWEALEEERRRMAAEAEEKEQAGDASGGLEARRLAQRCQAHITALEQNVPTGFPGEEVCKYCGFRMILGGPKQARSSEHLGEGAAAWEEEHVKTKCHRGFVEIHERLERLRDGLRARRDASRGEDAAERRGEAQARSRSRGQRPAAERSARERSAEGRGGRRGRSRRKSRSRSRGRERRRDRERDGR
mmetsp:Transcript_37861/g.91008  ORF Transcript_37861/g.91008 Transcript_37861/m.91008 type:complete len:318 (+) Transcript_37861:70-1023(+)